MKDLDKQIAELDGLFQMHVTCYGQEQRDIADKLTYKVRDMYQVIKAQQDQLDKYKAAVEVIDDDEEPQDRDLVSCRDYGQANKKFCIFYDTEWIESVQIIQRSGKPVIKRSQVEV